MTKPALSKTGIEALARRTFYWHVQEGDCYLMISPGCLSRDREMSLNRKDRRAFATLEHIRPRALKGQIVGNALYACSECNGLKGQLEISIGADFELASLLSRLYSKHCVTVQAALVDTGEWDRPDELRLEAIEAIRCPLNRRKRLVMLESVGIIPPEDMPFVKLDAGVKVFKTAEYTNPVRLDRARAAANAIAAAGRTDEENAALQRRSERKQQRAAIAKQYGGAKYRNKHPPPDMVDDSPEQKRAREIATQEIGSAREKNERAYAAAQAKFAAAMKGKSR